MLWRATANATEVSEDQPVAGGQEDQAVQDLLACRNECLLLSSLVLVGWFTFVGWYCSYHSDKSTRFRKHYLFQQQKLKN